MYISRIAYVQTRDIYISEISFRDIMNWFRDITNWIHDITKSIRDMYISRIQIRDMYIAQIHIINCGVIRIYDACMCHLSMLFPSNTDTSVILSK